MRVILHTRQGTVGEVQLVGGVAIRDGRAVEILDAAHVVEPATLEELRPEDGERYLRALVPSVSGTYLWATLEEEA